MTSFLLEMLAKSVLVVAVAATVAWVKKDASAAQRHMVWSAAFLVLLLLPLVHWILPRWPVPILPNSSMHVAPLEKVRIAAAQRDQGTARSRLIPDFYAGVFSEAGSRFT